MPVELPKYKHFPEIVPMFKLVQYSGVTPRVSTRTATLTVLVALVSILASACSGDHSLTGPGASKSMTISFATRSLAPVFAAQINPALQAHGDVLAPAGTQATRSLQAVNGKDTLIIARAQLVLSRVELTQTAGTPCDDDSSESGCTEIERHFVLVDLPTDTSVHTVLDANIPDGTYASLEARLRTPRSSDDSAATAFLSAHPELAGANVRVEGTFDGQPFTYLGVVDTRFELTFTPPIAVTGGGVNVTVLVDATMWFRDRTGAVLDPSSANAGGLNASVVSDNIRRSFRAVRDDERDGHDHGGDDGGHHG
jgi:hypothetical protein